MAYMIWGRMAQHISKIKSMASIGSILLRIYHPYVATMDPLGKASLGPPPQVRRGAEVEPLAFARPPPQSSL